MSKNNLGSSLSELTELIKSIKLVELSALQSTNAQKVLRDLQVSLGELQKFIAEQNNKEKILVRHDKLVQAVDTAGLMGVISNDELTRYYELLDKIWAGIEKEL